MAEKEDRRPPSDRDLLVMFICRWRDEDGTPAVDWDWARGATDREIIHRFRSLYEIDHYPFPRWTAEKGSERTLDRGWNYAPRRIAEHREKTARIDIPEAAKSKRIQEKHEEFRRKVLAKSSAVDQLSRDKPNRPKKKWPSRKVGYRKFDGTPVWPDRDRDRTRKK